MLAKAHRISRTELLIIKASRRARHVKTQDLSISFSPNKLRTHKFAFIISKKVDNRATQRNKLKRALINIAQHYLKDRKITAGYNIIVRLKAKQQAPQVTKIKEQFTQILSKI